MLKSINLVPPCHVTMREKFILASQRPKFSEKSSQHHFMNGSSSFIILLGYDTVKDSHTRSGMYMTINYLDLATDTQYLEPCLQSWNIRRCQSALEGVNIEDSSSDGGQNWGQDKRPSVRFLLAPHKDQEPGEAGRLFLTSPTPSSPADQPRQGLPGQSGDNENCLAGLESA